jgi:membrane fusion protein (multidrug efflux system)
MAEKVPLKNRLRVIIPSVILGIGAIIGLRYGIDYWIYSVKHVVTDDARVKGRMVSVAPEVSGTVKVLPVDEGSVVKRGDVLLEVSNTTYDLQVQEAQAQVEMQEHRLREQSKELTLDLRRAEDQLAQARAELVAKQSALEEERAALILEREQVHNQLVEAEAALKEAESTARQFEGQVRIATSNWDRVQTLFKEGIVSGENRDKTQEELGQARARLSAAEERVAQLRARLNGALTSQKRIQLREKKVQTLEAEVEKGRANVRLAETENERSKVRQSQVQVMEAQLKEARAKAERMRNDLRDTVLRSPVDGVISRKRVEEGQLVQKGQPVLVIGDPKDVWVLANIKESYIRDVVIGQSVDVRVDAYPDRRFEGEVVTIGHAAISEFALFPPTGSFTKVEQRIPVEISINDPDELLKPGMMVVVGIVKK